MPLGRAPARVAGPSHTPREICLILQRLYRCVGGTPTVRLNANGMMIPCASVKQNGLLSVRACNVGTVCAPRTTAHTYNASFRLAFSGETGAVFTCDFQCQVNQEPETKRGKQMRKPPRLWMAFRVKCKKPVSSQPCDGLLNRRGQFLLHDCSVNEGQFWIVFH